MASLHQSVAWADMQMMRIQINPETKELRTVSLVEAAAKKHGPTCKCEACASLHMQRTRDKRMKAMMPGNVDMGNRQPATMGKAKASSVLRGKHIGFKKLEKQLSHEKGIDNPGGLAYTIGKKKFGKKGMQKKAVA